MAHGRSLRTSVVHALWPLRRVYPWGGAARIRGLLLPLFAAAAIFLGAGAAWAYPRVDLWPPPGDSTLNGCPSGPWGCYPPNTWQHSLATHVFDGGSLSGLYLYYFDVYGGVSTTNAV